MLFNIMKRMIERNKYGTREEMIEKMNVLLLSDQITVDQYAKLIEMLDEKEA